MNRSPAPEKSPEGQPGAFQAALFGLCPHCRARTLFEAPAMIAGDCSACAQPLSQLERGGRVAGLLTVALAALLILAALVFDEYVRPPIWVHVAIWTPVTIGAVLFALRYFKAASVYHEYKERRIAPVQRETR